MKPPLSRDGEDRSDGTGLRALAAFQSGSRGTSHKRLSSSWPKGRGVGNVCLVGSVTPSRR